MSQAIIEVNSLSKVYDGRVILENVNFSVKKGEIFVIVGGSGCGKSTLLRQLIGLETPTDGEILVAGNDLVTAKGKVRENILKKYGVLFQFSGLFASMTIEENIALQLETYTDLSKEDIRNLVRMKLAAVGLDGFQGHYPSEISGGMKKRAALARALALDPDILFFDEPSSGLDPVTSASLDKLIKELNSSLGSTMVIVTHDLDSILSISDRIIMLDKSVRGIIAEGTPEELKSRKEMPKVYNFFNRIPDL
jgi:phospholipid/cholesterol/gamma-HCH transport system ATP-binding protein